jgi:hypothetical protein
LINDIRNGAISQGQAIALERQLLDTVRSCSPKTDIYLKTENSLLSTDVGSLGYVTPNASSSAYSAILEAVPMAFTNAYPNLVTLDMQQALYGTVSLASSSAPYMADQLHPSAAGQTAEANQDIQVLTNLRNNGFQVTGPVDPNSPNTLVPFSPFLAANARANNYSQPWATSTGSSAAMYPYACADPIYYTLVASGAFSGSLSAGQSFFRMTWNGTVALPVQPYDVVEQQSAGCWQLNGSATVSNFSNGVGQISLGGGQTTPSATVSGEQINIYRPKYPSSAAEGYLKNPAAYPYARQINIGAGGNGFFDLSYANSEGMNAVNSALSSSDLLLLNNTITPFALTSFSCGAHGTGLRCLGSGDFTSLNGQFGYAVGTHPLEGKPDTSGNVIFTGNLAVGYRSGITTNTLTVSSSTGLSLVTVLQNGNVGIGTTSPQYLLHVGSASVSGVVSRFQNSAGTCDINPTTTSVSCSSDVRLKKNVATMDDQLAKLLGLRPVLFNWNSETASSPPHPGFIAQEVETTFPELVSTDAAGYKSIGISNFVPYLVSGMQALDQKIQALQGSFTANATATNLSVYSPTIFSGDSVGQARITAGATSVRITFTQAYTQQPIITATPIGDSALADGFRFTVKDVEATGFTIQTLLPATSDVTFDWHSFASPGGKLFVSGGATQSIPLVLPVDPAASTSLPSGGSSASADTATDTLITTATSTEADSQSASSTPSVSGPSSASVSSSTPDTGEPSVASVPPFRNIIGSE